MTRRRLLIVVVAVAVAVAVLAAGYWQFATHTTPAGQAPLTYLDPASLSALKEDFNRAAGETRIIVLLSPT